MTKELELVEKNIELATLIINKVKEMDDLIKSPEYEKLPIITEEKRNELLKKIELLSVETKYLEIPKTVEDYEEAFKITHALIDVIDELSKYREV